LRHVALGDYVKEGNALFQVVDLTKVWVLFDAYESDLPWLKKETMLTLYFNHYPGKSSVQKLRLLIPSLIRKPE